MIRSVAFLLLGAGAFGSAQESDLDRLIRLLEHDDIAERDSAFEKLIAAGDPAIDRLRRIQSRDPEVSARIAGALARLEQDARIRSVYQDPPVLQLDCAETRLGAVLQALSSQAGLTFKAEGLDPRRELQLARTHGTPLEMLDLLCGALGNIRWVYEEDQGNVIGFREGRPSPKPSSYSGRFRVSLRRADLFKTTDFDQVRTTLTLVLEALAERGLRMTGLPVLTVDQVLDENGKELARDADSLPRLMEPFPSAEDPIGPLEACASEVFTYRGMDPSSRKLARLKGSAVFSFPLRAERVVMDVSQGGRLEKDALVIDLLMNCPGRLQIAVHHSRGEPVPSGILDQSSFRIVDVEGEEHAPAPVDITIHRLRTSLVTYTVSFDDTGGQQARSLSFDLVQEVYERRMTFEFRDLPLP